MALAHTRGATRLARGGETAREEDHRRRSPEPNGLDYTWTADLEVTGCHEGSLVADVEGFAFPASATGTVVAEYDDERREGLPAR